MISFELYDRLLQDRPFKFAAEDVNYTDSTDEYHCKGCVHFYTRKIDGWSVCEILRDVQSDDDEKPIDPEWRCDFWTSNGTAFPYLDEKP